MNNSVKRTTVQLSVLGLALFLVLFPILFASNNALNLLIQICIAAVLALSFNLLLGQTGLLSFGHAVYSGIGTFAAVHVLNSIQSKLIFLPVSLVPLVAGFAGLFFGFIFAWLSSQKAGLSFSMISLAIGELLFTAASMFPSVFGGEGGVSTNRVVGTTFGGVSFGPQIELYYLILCWTFLTAGAIYFITRTSLGMLARAVRDNAERVAFLGYSPRTIRLAMLCCSHFFAGIAGGMAALHFEFASTDNFSMWRSGSILFFTYIGGIHVFMGPVLGAFMAIIMSVFLSELTPAWQLYLGLIFMLTVSFAPNGLSGILATWIAQLFHSIESKTKAEFLIRSGHYLLSSVSFTAGLVLLIELLYRWRFPQESLHAIVVAGLSLNADTIASWLFAAVLCLTGVALKPRY